jgi:hypothetical protein
MPLSAGSSSRRADGLLYVSRDTKLLALACLGSVLGTTALPGAAVPSNCYVYGVTGGFGVTGGWVGSCAGVFPAGVFAVFAVFAFLRPGRLRSRFMFSA